MLRHAVCAAVVLAFSFGSARADEFFGLIKKIEEGKISVTKLKKGEKPGEPVSMKLAKKVKVVNGKFNKDTFKVEAGDELDKGLKNERFKEIGKRGVPAVIVTNADNEVTEIRVLRPFKKRNKD
jgi:hypothetical protein